MKLQDTRIILLDNGSVKAAATLQLRKLSAALSEASGTPVEAVSLRHAERIPLQQLNGISASTLAPYLASQLSQGVRHFVLVPLFFARSGALTQYLPQQMEKLEQKFGVFKYTLADVVYPLPDGEPRLARTMQSQLGQTSATEIILLDHGSPDPQVTAVRQHLATQIRSDLDQRFTLHEAVMERRPGANYDFNGDLLETKIRQLAQQGARDIFLLMQFFLPGRHAGSGGDVEQICQRLQDEFEGLQISLGPLIGFDDALIPILQDRLQSALREISA